MQDFVSHPLVKENSVESRLYQEVLVARVLEKGNSLVVAPTALGKTIVAVLLAAEMLRKQSDGKVLFLAPTKPLAVQHQKSMQKFLKIEPEQIELLTGSIAPKKRKEIWEAAKIVNATPQTIENDLMEGRIGLQEVSLLIFDEAHRAMGDYSYVYIAQQYIKQSANPLVLALTASPGGEEERIKDVCKNLFIKNVEIKTQKDEDVKQYAKEIELHWIRVDLPAEFSEIKKYLQEFISEQVAFIKKTGFGKRIHPSFQRQKDLLELQNRIWRQLQGSGKKYPVLYQLASRLAALLKINHAVALLETQGIPALYDYFEKSQEKSGKAGAPKALKIALKDERVQKAIMLTNSLHERSIVHPKIETLVQLLKQQFELVPESRVIVFNHYRDSAKHLTSLLEKEQSIKPLRFVGQATKERDKGMNQKEQAQAIKEFKEGKYNCLIATSVAEEGLDIPEVDLVVFYEAVPSEIRAIQRRGRTGRLSKGKCYILLTKHTRDEAFYWSSVKKEQKMHETLHEMKRGKEKVLEKQSTLVKYFEQAKDKALIYADTREQSSAAVKKLIELGAFVKVKQLEVGDFVLSDDIVVERKTVSDFLESMVDGRLFKQLKKMAENYSLPLMLVEGNMEEMYSLRNIHKNAVIGALTSIALNYRTPVLFTKDAEESAEYMYVTAKREQSGKDKEIRLRVGRKGLTLAEQQRYLVEGLPLVGPAMAKNLLKKFGSVKKVFNASEKQLQKIEKIGEKKAKEIRKIVETDFKEE